jgi:hypothetical protein
MSSTLLGRRTHVITRRTHFFRCRTRLFHMNTLANKNEYGCRKMNASIFCRRIQFHNCRTHFFIMNTLTNFMNTSWRKMNSAFFMVISYTLLWIRLFLGPKKGLPFFWYPEERINHPNRDVFLFPPAELLHISWILHIRKWILCFYGVVFIFRNADIIFLVSIRLLKKRIRLSKYEFCIFCLHNSFCHVQNSFFNVQNSFFHMHISFIFFEFVL